jgi:hypothetical protein
MDHLHPRSGPHDIGGLGADAIDHEQHDDAQRERGADATRMLLADAQRTFFTTNGIRSLQERLDSDTSLSLPYGERWIHAFSSLIVTNGAARDAEIARMDARGEHLATRPVARAGVDRGFRARLAADGKAAEEEAGIPAAATRLTALFNTPVLHNLVVCTLCSWNPRTVLGRPPTWYEARASRAREAA